MGALEGIILVDQPEEERVMENTQCQELAIRFEQKAARGLRDVKFFLHNIEDVETEEVCHEVNRLYAAMEAGDFERLDFGDLAWKEVA